MTEKEALESTKYFGAGVCAQVSCYAGSGRWVISICRQETVMFMRLDELERAVWELAKRLRSGEDLELWPDDHNVITPVTFYTAEDAVECVAQIQCALDFVRSVHDGDEWVDPPPGLLSSFPKQGD